MHYFIDGYNLLFRLSRDFQEDDLQSQRETIIQELSLKITELKMQATLVFDAAYQTGLRSRKNYDSLEILFTEEGETADECILDELKKCRHPKNETVVTSDKKLAWYARRRGAKTQSTEGFLQKLSLKIRKKAIQKKLNISVKKAALPLPAKKTESVEDFYLRIFEERLAKEQGLVKESKLGKSKKTHAKLEKKAEQLLSDYERWLKAFEENGA